MQKPVQQGLYTDIVYLAGSLDVRVKCFPWTDNDPTLIAGSNTTTKTFRLGNLRSKRPTRRFKCF
jgi:hypothetical protein